MYSLTTSSVDAPSALGRFDHDWSLFALDHSASPCISSAWIHIDKSNLIVFSRMDEQCIDSIEFRSVFNNGIATNSMATRFSRFSSRTCRRWCPTVSTNRIVLINKLNVDCECKVMDHRITMPIDSLDLLLVIKPFVAALPIRGCPTIDADWNATRSSFMPSRDCSIVLPVFECKRNATIKVLVFATW
jgi:hypothetical protein